MKRHIEEIMVYDDYTREEVIELVRKRYRGYEEIPFGEEELMKINKLMNGLQKIYGAEEKETDDDSLLIEAIIFVYHIDELEKLISNVK